MLFTMEVYHIFAKSLSSFEAFADDLGIEVELVNIFTGTAGSWRTYKLWHYDKLQ